MTADPSIERKRLSKANAKKRRKREEARKRQAKAKPYQAAARPEKKRARVNRKAERFDVDQGRGWIVVKSKYGRFTECAAVMRSAGCPVFEARHAVRITRKGRSVETMPPMMRRLMFVGVDAPEQACLLADLDYVEGILCRGEGLWLWADTIAIHGARPAVISPVMMKKFADHITGHKRADQDVGEFVETLFNPGDLVRVTEGPFASFDAVVEEVNAAKGQYDVAVSIFGRATKLTLEEKALEAA